MSTVNAQLLIWAPTDKVWEKIAGFGSLASWCSSVNTCHLSDDGLYRYLQTRDGDSVVERLLGYSEKNRFYSYTITSAPFQVEAYEATLSAIASGPDATLVTWSCEFRAGAKETDTLRHAFAELFHAGLQDLRNALELPRKS